MSLARRPSWFVGRRRRGRGWPGVFGRRSRGAGGWGGRFSQLTSMVDAKWSPGASVGFHPIDIRSGCQLGAGSLSACRPIDIRTRCQLGARTPCAFPLRLGTGRDPRVTTFASRSRHGRPHSLQGAWRAGEAAGVRDLCRPHAGAHGEPAPHPRDHGVALCRARLAGVPVPAQRPRLRRDAAAAVAGARLSHGGSRAGARRAPRCARRSTIGAAAGLVCLGRPAAARRGRVRARRPAACDDRAHAPHLCGRPGRAAERPHDAALAPRGPLAPRAPTRR